MHMGDHTRREAASKDNLSLSFMVVADTMTDLPDIIYNKLYLAKEGRKFTL